MIEFPHCILVKLNIVSLLRLNIHTHERSIHTNWHGKTQNYDRVCENTTRIHLKGEILTTDIWLIGIGCVTITQENLVLVALDFPINGLVNRRGFSGSIFRPYVIVTLKMELARSCILPYFKIVVETDLFNSICSPFLPPPPKLGNQVDMASPYPLENF